MIPPLSVGRALNQEKEQTMSDNPYDVLGLVSPASDDEIALAYKIAAKKHHPDAGGDAEAFRRVQEAYELLCDPMRRKMFDETGLNLDSITHAAVTDLRKLMAALAEQIVDPSELGSYDLLDRINKAVDSNYHNLNMGIAHLDKRLDHLKAVREQIENRMKRKPDATSPDIFLAPILGLIKTAEEAREKTKNTRMVLDSARKLLADYTYEYEPPATDAA